MQMIRDERWMDAMEERYERLRASSTCGQCAWACPAEADMGYLRRQAERFMRLVRPADDVTRTVDSLTGELAMMLFNETTNVHLCEAHGELTSGDAPVGGCSDFEPADAGWSQ